MCDEYVKDLLKLIEKHTRIVTAMLCALSWYKRKAERGKVKRKSTRSRESRNTRGSERVDAIVT